MDRIKLTNLYDEVIDGNKITVEILQKCGFSQADLIELINSNVLKRADDGYEFLDVHGLYGFGVELKDHGYGSRAVLCHKRCRELDFDYYYRSFYKMIENKDYFAAVDFIFHTLMENYRNDGIQFLFMINYMGGIPGKRKGEINRLISKRKGEEDLTNLEKTLYQYKFTYAKKLHGVNKSKKDIYKEAAFRSLLNSCILKAEFFKKNVIDLAKKRKLKPLQKKLEVEQSSCGLNDLYVHILMVLQDLEECKRSKEIPEVISDDEVTHAFEAIELGDYERAILLLNDFSNDKTTNDLSLVLKIVLKEMISEVNKLKRHEEIENMVEEEDPGQILNLTMVLEVILTGSVSFSEVQEQFDLNVAQLCVVKLEIAKGFYRMCMTDVGDQIVREVKVEEVVSKCVSKMYEEAMVARENGLYAKSSVLTKELKRINPQVLFRK